MIATSWILFRITNSYLKTTVFGKNIWCQPVYIHRYLHGPVAGVKELYWPKQCNMSSFDLTLYVTYGRNLKTYVAVISMVWVKQKSATWRTTITEAHQHNDDDRDGGVLGIHRMMFAMALCPPKPTRSVFPIVNRSESGKPRAYQTRLRELSATCGHTI